MRSEIALSLDVCCPLCDGMHAQVFHHGKRTPQQTYYRCPQCDLVFVQPEDFLTQEQEKARYDQHNNDDSQHYVDFLSRLAHPIIERMRPNSHGLNFGSGASQAMAECFRAQGHQCDCYDIFYFPEQELLEVSYDFIVASEVIEHLHHPQQVFEQWLNILHPNGLLGVMTGIRPADDQFPNWWYKNDPTHVMLFSSDTFDYLSQKYGLEVVYLSGNVIIFSAP